MIDEAEAPASMCGHFQRTVRSGGDDVALRALDGSLQLSWREYGARVRAIAEGLTALGVVAGDTVGIMLTNRPEFHLVDAAVMHLGAVPFSIYNTSAREQIAFVLRDAGNRVIVTETQFVPRVRPLVAVSELQHLVCVDGAMDGCVPLNTVETTKVDNFDFETAWKAVGHDDVAVLIYTSGTTGDPKGVELTHANLLAATGITDDSLDIEGGSVISYLPDAHLANRYIGQYAPMTKRLSVTTVSDPKRLLEALVEVRPTVFMAVPQLWYRVKSKLEETLAVTPGVKGRLARWSVQTATQRARLVVEGAPVQWLLERRWQLADRLVLSALRKRLGLDRLQLALSGAAPIAEDAVVFVLALGVPLCEAWGLTETTATSTFTRPGMTRVGAVGTAAPNTEVRLAPDGELLVRGPTVMRGYRNNALATAEVIDADGWLYTGDIGNIDAEGYVRIVDRKKELIINSFGKNMSPANIENVVKLACPLVGFPVAIGDNRPHVAALLVLDAELAAELADSEGVPADAETLARHPRVLQIIADGIEQANKRLSKVEHIRSWQILPTYWEPGGDELTPTMKLRRKVIAAKYADPIEALYA